MLSLVILAQTAVEDIAKRNKEIMESLEELRISSQITYITTANYSALEDIKKVVGTNDRNCVIILGNETNRNSLIYVGLDTARGDNVLILDVDTNIETIKLMLQKYKDGAENVYVRQKEKGILNFFSKIGTGTYQLGLKMLKKLPDLCCEDGAILLNDESITTILNNPVVIKELINTNITPDAKFSIIQTEKVHDVSPKKNAHIFSTFGMLSMLFLIVSLGAMFFYPMFNEWIYSLWMFITIILWLALCVVICVLFSKQIFNTRQNEPIPLDVENFPLITIYTSYSHKELENEYKVEEVEAKETSKNGRAKKKAAKKTKTESKKEPAKVKTKKPTKTKKTTKSKK